MWQFAVLQVIVHHAPHRRVPGPGHGSNHLNRVLSVENIVLPVAVADQGHPAEIYKPLQLLSPLGHRHIMESMLYSESRIFQQKRMGIRS